MRMHDAATVIRILLVGILVLVWIATWLALDAASSEPDRGGIPEPAIFGGLAKPGIP